MIIFPYYESNAKVYQHTYDSYALTITKSSKFGLPYGLSPRLLYLAIINEIKKTKSPVLRFGRVYFRLLRILQISKDADRKHHQISLSEQMLRFFSANISCSIQKRDDENKPINSSFNYWWCPFKGNKENITASSTIVLEKYFYDELINFPFSIDFNVIKRLSDSPIFIDVFLWITYQLSVIKEKEIYISWAQILSQLNSNPVINIDFKKQIIQAFYVVIEFFPALNIKIINDGLFLIINQRCGGVVETDQNFDIENKAICSIIHMSSGGK